MRSGPKMKSFHATIIGGKYRGKQIEIPAIQTTRGSKAILKESLFNVLQFEIIGKNFVEVFGGSGGIGLEACSRGALRCYFIEQNPAAYAVLRRNITAIDPQHCEALQGDSFVLFGALHDRLLQEGCATYFYFDPPFSIRDHMADIYEKTIGLVASIDSSICEMAIIEHRTQESLPGQIGQLHRVKKKRFGRSTLSYYRPRSY
jgi:16S rRNA (guanine966-N2)-methyltransferase